MGSSTPIGSADLLVSRFSKLAQLSEQECAVLRAMEARAKHAFKADNRLLTEGAEIRAPHILMSGWAAHVRELSSGRRQITGVLVPGDIVGLSLQPRPIAQTSIVALTDIRTIEAPEINLSWRERMPGLGRALSLAVAEQEYLMLGQITRLGRQTAHERMASWILETEYRLSSRGLATADAFPLPLTQEILADIAGLSVVHVNRTLKQMRRDGEIDLSRGRVTILDREALRAAGEFRTPHLSALGAPAREGVAPSEASRSH